jgi:AcrR family transcriptional regulator
MEKPENILRSASELFRKFGIKSVTMDDIAAELGISKKTLYAYFRDKTDLVDKLMDYELKLSEEYFNDLTKKKFNAIEEIFEINRFMVGMIKRYSPSFSFDLRKYYPEICRRVELLRRNRVFRATLENLRKGKEQELYRKELDEEILTRMYVFRIENLHMNQLFQQEETFGRALKEMFIYHIRGIANEKGIRFLEKNIHKLNDKNSEINQTNT